MVCFFVSVSSIYVPAVPAVFSLMEVEEHVDYWQVRPVHTKHWLYVPRRGVVWSSRVFHVKDIDTYLWYHIFPGTMRFLRVNLALRLFLVYLWGYGYNVGKSVDQLIGSCLEVTWGGVSIKISGPKSYPAEKGSVSAVSAKSPGIVLWEDIEFKTPKCS